FFMTRNSVVNVQDIIDFKKYSRYGLTILFIGVASELLGFVMPAGLRFFIFLLASFKFVVAIILYFSDVRLHRYIFYGSVVFMAFISLKKGLFHDFILWSAFFYMFFAIKSQPSTKMKLF